MKFDPRSRITNLMSWNRSPRLRARLRACCTVHSPVGFAVTPPRCIRRVPCSINTRTYSLFSSTVSDVQEVDGEDPGGLGVQELPPGRARAARRWIDARGMQDLPDGGRRDCHAEFVSSPWMRRCPHSGFSFARRTTRRVMPGPVGGRPGVRCLLVSYLPAASLRCQASSVAGVIGKISAQRPRGMSRASAANHTRSAGSYRTRRRGGAAPRSRGGARAAQHPSPGPCGISGQRGRVSGELAGRRS